MCKYNYNKFYVHNIYHNEDKSKTLLAWRRFYSSQIFMPYFIPYLFQKYFLKKIIKKILLRLICVIKRRFSPHRPRTIRQGFIFIKGSFLSRVHFYQGFIFIKGSFLSRVYFYQDHFYQEHFYQDHFYQDPFYQEQKVPSIIGAMQL